MTQTPLTISQLPDLGSVQGSDRLALDRIGAAVTAGAFVVGQAYQIVSVGNTSFTAIGAESNTVGAYFVATGAGTGTGTAGPINTGVVPLSAVAAAAPVQSVALSVPSGWTTSSTNTGGGVTLTLGLPSGSSLPSNAIQTTWTTGAALAGTAVQEGDIRLSDSREWSAATVSQAAAEAGTSTTRVAYNPLRMFQGIAAWWAASEFKAKLDGIAAGATANATDAQLRDRSSHTGNQGLSTISGLGTGIPTALAINVGTAGAPVILGGAGGTPSALALPNATGLPLTTGVTGILPIANGGTGTAIPGLVAGANVTISGIWPNQTISATGDGGPGPGGPGTVTSVGLTLPALFTVSGSPVTTSGTLTATLAAQSANLVLAGPATGAAAPPAFRSLVAGDIPTITAGQVSGLGTLATQSGTFSGTSSGTNTGDQDLSGLMVKASNLSDLVNAATARGNLGAAASGAITGSGLTMASNRLVGRSAAGTGPVEEFAPFGLAFSGTNLATLADVYIDLSDGSTPLTHSTTVAKKLTQILRTAMALTDLPVFAVVTAPTGAALQFDIKVNGTSIYATLPTIAAGSTNSTASPGTFASAFVTAGQVIAAGSVIAYFVTQVGLTVAGAGLLVILPTRRAG
jgi:hypothetical protein